MSDDEDEDVTIKPGSVIESGKARYVIQRLLGEGGFGAVYKVHDESDPSKISAMKVEKKLETRKHSKLKMEIAILKMVANERKQSHFTSIIDRGKKETFFFLVMELVGKSLDDLKKERPERVFSMVTGLGVACQCLEAVEDLHKFGFIHRDLKPANYACGLAEKKRVIYILDFGIARKITNDKGELKTPRASCRFKGTVRFAALNCHKGIEMGPKDDVESWFYLLIDLVSISGLPWRRLSDKNDVMRNKEECRRERRDIFIGVYKSREQLGKIIDYVDQQQYQDHVDYEYIYNLLEDAAQAHGGSMKDPYDWEVVRSRERSQMGAPKSRRSQYG